MSERSRHALWAVLPLPPPTLDTDRWVVARFPAAIGTVVTVTPDGIATLAPPWSEGPGALAVLKPDRLVYAPEGAAGRAYLLPCCAELPAPEPKDAT